MIFFLNLTGVVYLFPPVIAYPAVGQSNPPAAYVTAPAPPPPVGYPTKDDPQQSVPVVTTSRGDGFWKGW